MFPFSWRWSGLYCSTTQVRPGCLFSLVMKQSGSASLLTVQPVSLCLASGLVIISQLDKVINDPAKPAGPGTDANMQSDGERPELDAERGGPLIWARMPCFWAVPLSINNLEWVSLSEQLPEVQKCDVREMRKGAECFKVETLND